MGNPEFRPFCHEVFVKRLSAGDLTLELTDDAGCLRCVWKGKSNERQPNKVLAPWFEQITQDARERGVVLEMHFEELEHFNSSTITALIVLIQQARRDGVKLVMVYDQSLKWQRLSFDALRVFDKRDELFALRPVGG